MSKVEDKVMVTKTLDQKGRLTLGSSYAKKTFAVDDSDPTCIKLTPVVHIPEKEAWLYKNETALNQVRRGLEQARRGEFSESVPDIKADLDWLDDVDDDPDEWIDC